MPKVIPTAVNFNFGQGVDTKTDPKQVSLGKFLSLSNAVFQKGGLLQKRNGYGSLSIVPTGAATYLTTFNNNLTAIADSILAYSQENSSWVSKGSITPLSLSQPIPLIRSNLNQSQCDIAIAPNGLICTVYTDQNPSDLSESVYKFVIASSTTGQNIIEPSVIPVASGTVTGSPRVFCLGNYFILLFTNDISGTYHLQYIAISTISPGTMTVNTDIASSYVPSDTLSFDAYVYDNLYIAYYTTAGGDSVAMKFLTPNLILSGANTSTGAGYVATQVSVTVDPTNASNPVVYTSFYNSADSTGYTFAVNSTLGTIFEPIPIISDIDVLNITSVAQNGVCTVYYEVSNFYSYDPAIPCNYIQSVDVSFPVFFNGTFDSGSEAVTASSSAGLIDGMYVQDMTNQANIAAGTTFTFTGTALTLSQNTVGSSPYVFTIASSSVTSGAIYTNNGQTFTVTKSIVTGTTLTTSGTGAPTSTGTLTKSSGTGPSTIAFSAKTHQSDVLGAMEVTSPVTIIRGLGLASKAFILSGVEYFLSVYDDSIVGEGENGIQQTYFLVNGSESTEAAPIVIGKLAYQNAGGYLTVGLPNAIVNAANNSVSIPYLYKDLIQAVNKGTYSASTLTNSGFAWSPPTGQTSGIYTQTGINFATFTLSTENFYTTEIGSALQLSGGFGWMYDGYLPTEQNFLLYPSNVEATGAATGGAMPAQQYYYQVCYESADNNGNIYRSAPSVPVLCDLSLAAETTVFDAFFYQGYNFTTSPANATIGATYTDSLSNTWTVTATIVSGTTLVMSGSGTPPSSGVLTYVSGTGDPTITYSAVSPINTALVTSTAGLFVGQTVTDTTTGGNITTGTTITTISAATNTVTLSNPNAGSSTTLPGDAMSSVAAPISFHGFFYANQTQMVVDSLTGLVIGQYLVDASISTSLQANTYITDINTETNVVTVNFPFTANSTTSPGDTITTTSQCSATIDIPTLKQTYKVANPVKAVVYRWSVAQQEYFQVTTIEMPLINDTSIDFISFVDTLSDLEILGGNLIYTTGGVVEDVNPPASNIMTLWNTRLWMVDAEDPNLLWFSKQVIEGTPVEMSDLFTLYVAPTIGASGSTGPMTGLSSSDSNLIIFKKDAIYYVTGQGPDNTGNNNQFTDPIFITSIVGCANQQSIVFTNNGLMFQSDKGIWLLPRSLGAPVYIGAPVEAYTLGATVLSSVVVPGTNQVRFTMDSGITLMYDYYFDQWATFINVPAISACIYNSLHTYLDQYGDVYQETPNSYLDGDSPVLMSFQTGWLKVAGLQGYQRIYEWSFVGEYMTPHTLDIMMAYDFGAPSQQYTINPSNFTGVYGSDNLFGQTTPYGGPSSLENWRIQTDTQKCQAFQITMNEVYDATYGVPAGAGLTMSGINCILGILRSNRPFPASNTVGG